MNSLQRRRGRLGEDMAAVWLSSSGHHILERNFRSRCGEIDIIAEMGDTLAFIEVKARCITQYGYPAETITTQKLRKIRHTAALWLKCHPEYAHKAIHIDAIALTLNPEGGISGLEYIPQVL